MNSKKNSFKRVAAGALAVLTVAAYAAPVANVGGLPSVNVLTASAAENQNQITTGVTTDPVFNTDKTLSNGYVVDLAPDKSVTYDAAITSVDAETNTINIKANANYKRQGTTDRPAGYAWIGLAIKAPAEVTAVDDSDFANGVFHEWVGFNENSVANAILNKNGIITYNLTYSATKNGTTEDVTFTVKIDVKDSTVYHLADDTNGQYTNDVDIETVAGEITQGTEDIIEKYSNYKVADDTLNFKDARTFITSIKVETTKNNSTTSVSYTADQLKTMKTIDVEEGQKVTIVSKVPMEFYGGDSDEYGKKWTPVATLAENAKGAASFTASSNTAKTEFTYSYVVAPKGDAEDNENGVTVVAKRQKITVEKSNDDGASIATVLSNDADTYIADSLTQSAEINNEGKVATGFVVGDTIKVVSKKPFEALLTDGKTDSTSTTSYVNGLFEAEFIMPDSENVKLYLKDITEEYTYTVSGTKLLVSTKSGSISNAVVASLIVKYYDDAVDAAKDVDGTAEIGTEVGTSEVPSGKIVKVFYTEAAGNELIDSVTPKIAINGAAAADIENKEYIAAGTYSISYTVKANTTGKPEYIITKDFKIAAKDTLTAEDVKLAFTIGNNTDGKVILDKYTAVGKKSGVSEVTVKTKEAQEAQQKNNNEFTVTPSIVIGKNADGTDTTLAADKYAVTGYVSGSTLDKVYTFTVKIFDPEYGGSKSDPKTFDVKWRVNSFDAAPQFAAKAEAAVAEDNVNGLSDEIVANIALNEAAKSKASELKYQYVEGVGAEITEDELDDKISGLPTKNGTYTVYASYNDEIVSYVSVVISNNVLTYKINSKALDLTYSDKFDVTNFTLKDSSNKTVKNVKVTDVKYTILKAVVDEKTGEIQKNDNGSYKTTGNDLSANEFLNAGTYIVKITAAKDSGATKYVIKGEEQVLTVAQKALSADMITITPILYDGNTYDIVKDTAKRTVTAKDPITGAVINVKITEGSKESAVGTYKATVALNGTNGNNANFTGKTEADWHIIADSVLDGTNGYKVGLAWNEARTTLYDNGRIHLEVNRNANSQVTKSGTKVTVKKFGVVLDKAGKFDAPATYGAPTKDELAAVNAQLLVGNGFVEGGYTDTTEYKAADNTTYKTNITVKDATTGMWVRPYAIVEDSTGKSMIVYGETIYKNLETEAKEKLQLKMPMAETGDQAVRRADLKDAKPGDAQIKSGFNPITGKYYVYTSFKDLEDAGYSDLLEVSDFGVVVDKKGTFTAAGKLATDDKVAVADGLKLGKGFVEGHYDKNNSYLKVNEYAANITPKDSVTGVWVRPYLDLGNGLVVYGEPQYIQSVSSYFATSVQDITVQTIKDTTKFKLTVAKPVLNKAVKDANGKTVTVKAVKTGVVLDKKGLLSDTASPAELDAALLLNKGFIEGKKTENADTEAYTAKVTPASGKIYVRSYAVFDVNGIEITVYGAVKKIDVANKKVMEYNAANKSWTTTGDVFGEVND